MFFALHIAPTKGCSGAESLELRAFNGDILSVTAARRRCNCWKISAHLLLVNSFLLLVRGMPNISYTALKLIRYSCTFVGVLPMSTTLITSMTLNTSFSRPEFRSPRTLLPILSPTALPKHLLDSMERATRSTKTETLPSLPGLPIELIQKIYYECSDIKSVVNLSATSCRLRAAFIGSQKLLIIENVLENQFGPLNDAIQVVTYNASQPAHTPRKPAMSMALVQQLVTVGYTAQKWEAIYPMLRWRVESEHRRTLRPHEAYRFRRAMYRIWLYNKAFHNSDYLEHNRTFPGASLRDARLTFIRRFNNDEIKEITELNDMLHDMVHNDLCPSNATIQQRYSQSFPGQAPLYFGTYETYPLHGGMDTLLRRAALKRDLPTDLVAEAWGTWDLHAGVVSDILKLEPDQLLHFKEKLVNKAERVNYIASMSDTFRHRPSTLRNAAEIIMVEREYWVEPNHGIDGGILDFLGEEPGGRYKSPQCWKTVLGEVSSDEVVDEEDEDDVETDDENEVEVRGV